MSDLSENADWIEDCKRWIGRTLTGKFSHWCGEWDGLPIDETCVEFSCCSCWEDSPEYRAAKDAAKELTT